MAVAVSSSVSLDLVDAVTSLLEIGILTSRDDRWSRRRVLTAGTAAAAATSGEVSPQAVSGTITNTQGFTSPLSVAIGSVWVTDHNGNSLSKLDPVTGSILSTYTYATGMFVKPFGVVAGFDSIWVTNHNSLGIDQGNGVPLSSTVSRIDPATNTVVATIFGVSRPIGIAASSNHVWVANNGGAYPNTVAKIDPSDNTLTRITIGAEPYAVAAGFGSIWVTGHVTGNLYRINPSTNAFETITGIGTGSRGIAAGSDAMWVTHYNSGTVSRVNPSTNAVTATYTVGTTPWGIAADANGVWVANFGSNDVSKIIP